MSAPSSVHAEALETFAEVLARLAASWWREHGERRPLDPSAEREVAASGKDAATGGR